MSSKTTTSLVLFLTVNLLFFALVSSCDHPTPKPSPKPKPPKPTPTPHPTPKPKPTPAPETPYEPAKCPRDTLKIGACANVLGGILGIVIGKPPTAPCCSLIEGLVDLEAATCLCTAIKLKALGLKLNIPVSLSLLLNVCGRPDAADGFKCA